MARRDSKRRAIELEVERRIESGEPLTVRAIVRAVGGSATTVLDVLNGRHKSLPPAAALFGELVSPVAKTSVAPPTEGGGVTFDPVLFQRVIEASVESAVNAALSTLQKDLHGTVAYSMDKAEYGYQRMMEIADAMKHLFNDVASGRVPLKQPTLPRPSVASAAASGAAQMQALQAQIMRLDKQKQFLLRVISNSGIDVDLDGLDEIK